MPPILKKSLKSITQSKNIQIDCQRCGKVIQPDTRGRRRKRFCSRKCYSYGWKEVGLWKVEICSLCGNAKSVLMSRLKYSKRIFCNMGCQRKFYSLYPPRKSNGTWMENGYKVLYVGGGKGIKEHRKIIQDIIGRKLNTDEVIHHINGITTDNRPENLKIMSRSDHTALHRNELKKERG